MALNWKVAFARADGALPAAAAEPAHAAAHAESELLNWTELVAGRRKREETSVATKMGLVTTRLHMHTGSSLLK